MSHLSLLSAVACLLHLTPLSAFHLSSLLQCPHKESACRDNVDCDNTAMSKRAGYFCDTWPFYSGGFAECCDEDWQHSTCTHSVYDPVTNAVFCDFWYKTRTSATDELQLCDCKVNNGEYCTSWICAKISGYDFADKNQTNAELLAKLLLPNEIEIFGVHQCGFFLDHNAQTETQQIPQYCYQYDDFKSCFCALDDGSSADEGFCKKWECHQYLNNAKNDLSLDTDYADWKESGFLESWNVSDLTNEKIDDALQNRSVVDLIQLSTPISHETFECVDWYPKQDSESVSVLDSVQCTKWKGSLTFDDRFSVQECGVEAWNADADTFDVVLDKHWNVTSDDLVDSYVYKWECHEKGMEMRNNDSFMNFYLSTIIWSVCVGFIGLWIVFCYMRYKYISLTSFFCVQGWFLFIFGSAAVIHGGVASFVIYFVLQFVVLVYIIRLKWRNKGKQPYGSVSQRYDFDESKDAV